MKMLTDIPSDAFDGVVVKQQSKNLDLEFNLMTALSEAQLQDGMQQFVHEFDVALSSERKQEGSLSRPAAIVSNIAL